MKSLLKLKAVPKILLSKRLLPALAVATLAFFLFFWRLGTLTPGLSAAEDSARASSSTAAAILDNPIYGPHKFLQFLSQQTLGAGAFNARLVSALFALAFLFSFYLLVRRWFGRMVATFATLFLAATPWFMLLARSARPEILLLAPLILISLYYWLSRSRRLVAFYVLFLAGALSFYIPGMLWLSAVGLYLTRHNISDLTSKVKKLHKITAILLTGLIIAPLIYTSIKDVTVIKNLLLIPADWASLLTILKSIVWSFWALIWRTPVHSDFAVGRLPMLDVAQIALVVFGSFALYTLARAKAYLFAALAVFAILVAGINQSLVLLTLVLPTVAIAVAAGLRYLYMEWKSVFPKNPIPHYLAILLIAGLTALHVGYGVRYSLIAWPNTTDTRTTFVLK